MNDSGNHSRRSLSDFRPSATWETLQRRAELAARLRSYFAERGFCEVETPLLSRDTVVDRHLEPLRISDPLDRGGPSWYLQTSPEFAMKRLLAAGAPAIFQICKAFRSGESGRLHNPEFTMLEWYAVGQDLDGGVAFLSELANSLLNRGAAEVLTYRDAFRQFAHVDPLTATPADLAKAAQEQIPEPPTLNADDIDDVDAWRDLLLVECVEPHLGRRQPTILVDYPASQAALARIRDTSPPVAERFELYVDGIELANGYHELLDPELLSQRNRQTNALRQQDQRDPLPETSHLLAAMQHGLPPCCGVALGFDRLLMILLDARDIREVIAFPYDRA